MADFAITPTGAQWVEAVFFLSYIPQVVAREEEDAYNKRHK
jgi:hypothetical protein